MKPLLMARGARGRLYAVLTREWEDRKATIRCWPGPDRPPRPCRKYDLEIVDCTRVSVKAGTFRCMGLQAFGRR